MARFSFRLGIPAIGAVGVFELGVLLGRGPDGAGLSVWVVGTFAVAVTG